MLAGIYRDWPTLPETRANTPVRSDKAKSSQAGGVHKLLPSVALPGEYYMKAIPWFEQILKVFVRGPVGHNGRNPNFLSASCFKLYQSFLRRKKKPRPIKDGAFLFDAWQSPTWM